MLTHPTHGRLVTLGLTGMAKALDEQQRQPDVATLASKSGLLCSSTAKPPSARTNGWSAACASQASGKTPSSRIST